jgi:uncharacterized protein YegJ (DUF2314 family)
MVDASLVRFVAQRLEDLPPLPIALLTAFGATDEQATTVQKSRHSIAITAHYRPGWPPLHEWAARGLAAAIASRVDGLLIDVFTPRVLDPDEASGSLPSPDRQIRVADWVLVPQSAGDGGDFDLATNGLSRFGLPELRAAEVPPALAGPYAAVLSGVASRLLSAWTSTLAAEAEPPAFLEVPTEIQVAEADVARAYDRVPMPDGGSVRLGLRYDGSGDPDATPVLRIVPPPDFSGTVGEHAAAVCAALFGSQPDEIRRIVHGRAMEDAIAAAREALPSARERFLSRDLPAGGQIVVKHRLPAGDQSELVWSTVTSWPTAEHIAGVSLTDAESDENIRVGRAVRVDADAVVDWAVWINGAGIVEGGWTDRVLFGEATV